MSEQVGDISDHLLFSMTSFFKIAIVGLLLTLTLVRRSQGKSFSIALFACFALLLLLSLWVLLVT